MALKGLYRDVWKDETLRENKITQKTVILVLDAFGRVIIKSLKEKGVFKWKNHFILNKVRMKGWETKSIQSGEKRKIDDFNRIYIRPSANLKNKINDNE